MPYKYLDHKAEIGLRAWGPTLAEALAEGARGLLAVICDPGAVRGVRRFPVRCQGGEPAELFVALLNALISLQDRQGVLLGEVKIYSLSQNGGYHLEAAALGEPVDLERHQVRTEVKAATYSGLKYEVVQGQHVLQCVLDV